MVITISIRVFQTISLHDRIIFTPTEKPELVLSSNDRSLPTDERNLIVRAANALRDRFPTKPRSAHSTRETNPLAGRPGRWFV